MHTDCIARIFGGGKLWRLSYQKLLVSKSLLSLLTALLKFGEPPVIPQICYGFPQPKI